MYHHHGLTIGWSGFDIMHIQCAAFLIVKLHEIWREIKVGQIVETIIRGFTYFHNRHFTRPDRKYNNNDTISAILERLVL